MRRLLALLGIKPTPKPQPTPRHGLRWSLEEQASGWQWCCLHCPAAGSDPQRARADLSAAGHWMAAHTGAGVS